MSNFTPGVSAIENISALGPAWEHLSISNGGFPVPENLQQDSGLSTATLVIGIGGAGINCLKMLQKKVSCRLRRAEGIRFLAIDSDPDAAVSHPDKSQFFSLVPDTPIFQRYQEIKDLPQYQDCFSWFQPERIPEFLRKVKGTYGDRQMGRFLLVEKSDLLLNRLKKEMYAGIQGDCQRGIHVIVISGLSGGTGAGCFLDVCYLAQKAAADMGLPIELSGFFFLPDLFRDIYLAGAATHDHFMANAAETMQELEEAMKADGKEITYKYLLTLSRNRPPVDHGYLISTDFLMQQNWSDAYHRTMEMTSDYLMNFLYPGSFVGPAQSGRVVYRPQATNASFTIFGNYAVYVPIREISNYLIAQIFNRFLSNARKSGRETTFLRLVDYIFAVKEVDVEKIYNQLFREIEQELHVPLFNSVPAEYSTSGQMDAAYAIWRKSLSDRIVKSDGISRQFLNHYYSQQMNLISDSEIGPDLYSYFGNSEFGEMNIQVLGSLVSMHAGNQLIFSQREFLENAKKIDATRYHLNHHVRRFLFDSEKKRVTDYLDLHTEQSRIERSQAIMQMIQKTMQQMKVGESIDGTAQLVAIYDKLYRIARENGEFLSRNAGGQWSLDHDVTNSRPLFSLDEIRPEMDSWLDQKDYRQLYIRLTRGLAETITRWEETNSSNESSLPMTQLTAFLREFFMDELRPFLDRCRLSALVCGQDVPGEGIPSALTGLYENLHLQFNTDKIPSITGNPLRIGVYLEYPREMVNTQPENLLRREMQSARSRILHNELVRIADISPVPTSDPYTIRATALCMDVPLEAYPEIDRYRECWQKMYPEAAKTIKKPKNITVGTEANRAGLTAAALRIPKAAITDPYIFISYAHKDSDRVLPILKQMSQDGYNLWYDEHITAASSWSEDIANHILRSTFVISFMSANYLASDNCLDETYYIKAKDKKQLIIYLEPTILPPGLQLPLGRFQDLKAYFDRDEFYRKLYEADGISATKNGN